MSSNPHLRFDLKNFRVLLEGRVLDLRPQCLELLQHMAERPGQLLSKQELMDAVWQDKVVTAEDEVLEAFPDRRSSGSNAGMDIEKALQHIPPGARDVFVLHDVEGFRHEEIASMLSINIGTSKSQLHRARMLLRRRLEA